MKKLCKKTFLCLTVCFFSLMQVLAADEYSVFGGIKKEEFAGKKGSFVYEEMCFMTGSPVLLRGSIVIPQKPKKDSYSTTVKYALSSPDKNIVLDRSVTFDVVGEENEETGQLISNWTIRSGGIKESVTIGGEVFTLTAYDFDNSILRDRKPAGYFETGSLHYRKVFNTKEAQLEEGKRITITADSLSNVSYENIWSGMSSTIISQKIEFEHLPSPKIDKKYGPDDGKKPKEASGNWQADVIFRLSEKGQSKFDYINNEAKNTSFRRGLLKSTNHEYNVSYEYDLPRNPESKEGEKGASKVGRNKGKINLDSFAYDSSTMLPIPKYNDIGNHWAEESIFKMGSLGAFDLDASFAPDIYITRAQFARAILNTIDKVELESREKRKAEYVKSKRKGSPKLPFDDVRRDSEYYIFVEQVNRRKIMQGEGDRQFLPNRPLTREEAITIMIRALGIDDLAPALPFKTTFKDDAMISSWAKPALYQAVDFGIIEGYEDGRIKPKHLMTRAEASQLLARYIEHMRKEIPKDYKKLLNR